MPEQMDIRKENSPGNEYVRLQRMVEETPATEWGPIRKAFEEKRISVEEFVELTYQLDRKKDLIIDGLADTGNTLDEKIRELGIDLVTGLKKDHFLMADLGHLIAELNFKPDSEQERRHPPLCSLMVVALDVDNLKKWNDNGRHIGDRALRALTDSLRKGIREIDHIYRRANASDEFMVVLRIEKELTPDEVEGVFEQVKAAACTGYVEVNGRRLPVTASTGYTMVTPGDTREIGQILDDAHKDEETRNSPETKEKRIEDARKRLG